MLQPRIRAALASTWLALCLLPLAAARTVASSGQGRQLRSVVRAQSFAEEAAAVAAHSALGSA